jgi:drug/metabolite transporter (DMT)-like permease
LLCRRPPGGLDLNRAVSPATMRGLLLLTMALWGANLSVAKLLFESLEPMVVALLRMGVAALAMGVVVHFRPQRWPVLRPLQWLTLLACAALMLYVNQVFFAEGVSRTAAANGALIIALNPLLSALTAAALLGDRLTPARIAGVALGFGGVAAVVLHRPGAALGGGGLGDLLVFGSVLTWVLGGVLVQRLARELDSGLVSAMMGAIGTALLALHLALRPAPVVVHWHRITWATVALLVVSSLLATAVGALVWNRALVVLGVARTSLYAYWVPIFGVLFAVLLLGEPLSVWHGVGLAAVLGGTWLGTRSH